jgi:hypothetical protein
MSPCLCVMFAFSMSFAPVCLRHATRRELARTPIRRLLLHVERPASSNIVISTVVNCRNFEFDRRRSEFDCRHRELYCCCVRMLASTSGFDEQRSVEFELRRPAENLNCPTGEIAHRRTFCVVRPCPNCMGHLHSMDVTGSQKSNMAVAKLETLISQLPCAKRNSNSYFCIFGV